MAEWYNFNEENLQKTVINICEEYREDIARLLLELYNEKEFNKFFFQMYKESSFPPGKEFNIDSEENLKYLDFLPYIYKSPQLTQIIDIVCKNTPRNFYISHNVSCMICDMFTREIYNFHTSQQKQKIL